MWIGAGRIVLEFYNNDSESLKHKNIEALCKDLRKKFNISMIEVADFQDVERCVVGFAAVMPQNWNEQKSREMVSKICREIDETAFARVTVTDTELFSHGDFK